MILVTANGGLAKAMVKNRRVFEYRLRDLAPEPFLPDWAPDWIRPNPGEGNEWVRMRSTCVVSMREYDEWQLTTERPRSVDWSPWARSLAQLNPPPAPTIKSGWYNIDPESMCPAFLERKIYEHWDYWWWSGAVGKWLQSDTDYSVLDSLVPMSEAEVEACGVVPKSLYELLGIDAP